MSGIEQQIFERLRDWRRELAQSWGKPAYVVASDRSLTHLARIFADDGGGVDSHPSLSAPKKWSRSRASCYHSWKQLLLKLMRVVSSNRWLQLQKAGLPPEYAHSKNLDIGNPFVGIEGRHQRLLPKSMDRRRLQ